MEYRTFGRTGLSVSVCALGAGGASRLGLLTGSTEADAIAVIHRGMELGINYFDTAETYTTEGLVGRALEGHRDEVLISSKIKPLRSNGALLDKAGLRNGLENALRKLRTDHVDVYHLHRPRVADYDYCMQELVPELFALRDEGKVRFIAISDTVSGDAPHHTLQRAVQDECWDVMMTSFNIFNQSARTTVLPGTLEKNIAVEIMGAATAHFSRPQQFAAEVARLAEAGSLDRDRVDVDNPLSFLPKSDNLDSLTKSLTDASYRFALHEPGVNMVVVGTGSIAHLEANVRSLNAGPLPAEMHQQLVSLFGHLVEGTPPGGGGIATPAAALATDPATDPV